MDRLLIFDLKGPIAHFRKFYTSSSSLSYSFPPRTTLTGLIAGILGRERDSYYEEFGCNNCKVGLSIRKPIRKIMQTVNYLRTKEGDGYSTFEGVFERFIKKQTTKYPTPIELVVPLKLTSEVIYRIYFYHKNDVVMNELCSMLKNKRIKYPIFLGLSEFLADKEFIAEVPVHNVKEHEEKNNIIDVVSVCNIEHITRLDFARGMLQYIEEKMPLEFSSGREIKRTTSFIHEKNQKTIKAQFKIPYMEITYNDKGQTLKENITFME